MKTWDEALKYPTGEDCVRAAEEVSTKTGIQAMLAYAESAKGAWPAA